MVRDVLEIDKDTGKIRGTYKLFDNDTMGLIFDNKKTGQRATYLPGVFENISWEKIKTNLEQKSGYISSDNLNGSMFYMYNIKQQKKRLIDCVTDKHYFKTLRKTFLKTVL